MPFNTEKRAGNLEEAFAVLASGIFKSLTCRSLAADRLKRHNFWSFATVLVYSFSIIVFSILLLLDFKLPISTFVANLILLIVSLVVTLASIIWGIFDFKQQAYIFHRCQLELQNLNYRMTAVLAMKNELVFERYREMNSEYHRILDRYPNHKKIDFTEFQKNDTSSEKSGALKTKYKKRYYRLLFMEFSVYIILILSLLTVCILLFVYGSFPDNLAL